MPAPSPSVEDLSRARMYECQGTLIGGAVVARGVGISPQDYGFQMMLRQRIRWESLAGDLAKIARIYSEHYQVTYGFGDALAVDLTATALTFSMPPLAGAAAGQLTHWGVDADFLNAIQRGFWRAMEARAGVRAELVFGAAHDRVHITRA